MLHLLHINLVIGLMRADPFDPGDALLEIDRNHEPIVVAFDVEDDPLGGDNARSRITLLQRRHVRPAGFAHLIEPSIKGRLDRRLILVPGEAFDKLPQGAPGDDPHRLSCTMIPKWEQQS
jgi:hypothetical protein